MNDDSKKGTKHMQHRDLVTLANAIQVIRPDWHQAGIVAQLHILEANWTGSPASMFVQAMATAANPAAINPGALHTPAPPGTPQTKPKPVGSRRESLCYICGNTESACERQEDWEIKHGLPDPHTFETEEDATRKATPLTPELKTEIMSQISHLLKNVNDEPGMKHAVEAEKAKHASPT